MTPLEFLTWQEELPVLTEDEMKARLAANLRESLSTYETRCPAITSMNKDDFIRVYYELVCMFNSHNFHIDMNDIGNVWDPIRDLFEKEDPIRKVINRLAARYVTGYLLVKEDQENDRLKFYMERNVKV